MFLVVAAGHRPPNVFADPERFDVDRFLPPRICLGINVAQVEVTALAAHVRRHYRLSPIPGRVIRQVGGHRPDPARWYPRTGPTIAMRPAERGH